MQYYHYTIQERIQQIIDSGQINLATASVYDKKEKPVAWVSSNPIWEHTATKMVFDDSGNHRWLTFEEQLSELGCGRIIVKPQGIYTWAKLKHIANMNLQLAKSMEQSGINKGANPSEWFGSLTPIKQDRWIAAEIYKDGHWIPVQSFH